MYLCQSKSNAVFRVLGQPSPILYQCSMRWGSKLWFVLMSSYTLLLMLFVWTRTCSSHGVVFYDSVEPTTHYDCLSGFMNESRNEHRRYVREHESGLWQSNKQQWTVRRTSLWADQVQHRCWCIVVAVASLFKKFIIAINLRWNVCK